MLQERPDVTRTMIGVEAFTDLATAGDVARRAGLAPEVLANISKMQRAPGAPMSGPLFAQALDPTTAERIRHHFVLESVGEKTFKNVSQPIHVYRVIPPGIYEKIL